MYPLLPFRDLSLSLTSNLLHRLKADKDVAEKAYLFCTIDGRKEKVGNFRVEPPGLFRGRGEHPKKGTFKVSPFGGSSECTNP